MFLHKLVVFVSTAGLLCYMIGLNLVLWIINFISPSLAKKIILKMGEKVTMTQNPNFKYEDWGLTFTTANFVKATAKHMWLSLGQEAFVGLEAPDSPVVTMEGKNTTICSFVKGVDENLPGLVQPYLLLFIVAVSVCVCFHRKQTVGVEFWKLHLTPVYFQT